MKLVKIALVLLLLVGCSHQSGTGEDETSSTTTTTVITTTQPTVTTTTTVQEENYPKPEYHEQLMAGDFSAIAGEYENSEGNIYTINELGVRDDNEYVDGEIVYNLERFENLYLVSMQLKGDQESGWLLIIVPKGIPIKNIDTDTTKIRIYYGQDYPTEKNRIYTKKEE